MCVYTNKALKNLYNIYQENIQWLNFAELKNGALLAVAGVFLGFIDENIPDNFLKYFFSCVCILAIIVCCMSFIPFLNSNDAILHIAKDHYVRNNKNSNESKNIIFYVNIFLSEESTYKAAVKSTLKLPDDYTFSPLEDNYIRQIKSISEIASIKYLFFRIAMYIFLVAIVIFALILIVA